VESREKREKDQQTWFMNWKTEEQNKLRELKERNEREYKKMKEEEIQKALWLKNMISPYNPIMKSAISVKEKNKS